MFTSFDENIFRQAIKDKDYIRLKTDTVSTMLNDPALAKGETMRVIEILKKEVPEIFEEEIVLGFEERLEPSQWDKHYFTKLTYWFEENFAISRIAYIQEVGRAITPGVVPKTEEMTTVKNEPVAAPNKKENTDNTKQETVKIFVEEEKTPDTKEKITKIPEQKNKGSEKAVVKPTFAPKKKSKLPIIIVAAIAVAIVVAVVLITGQPG